MLMDEVIQELDALIARRRAAREILASMLSGQPAAPAYTIAPATAAPLAVEIFPAADGEAQHAPVRVVVLKPRQRRERRGALRPVQIAKTALSGVVPHGPVAISPRDLAHTASSKSDAVTEISAPVPNAFDELMAEVTRRTMARA